MGPSLQFTFIILCSLLVLAIAFSPEELALRNAILSAGPKTFILTKDINLAADLPELPNNKVLKVEGKCGRKGRSPCAIRGGKLYRHFWKSGKGPVSLTLENLIITATKVNTSAVEFGGARTYLTAHKVRFIKNPRAIDLTSAIATVKNSLFTGHAQSAIRIASYDVTDPKQIGKIKIVSCRFSRNRGSRGGAISVLQSASATIEKSTFAANSAEVFGGALYFELEDTTTPEEVIPTTGKVTSCTFSKNTAQTGGAVALRNALVKFYSSTFKENVAAEFQGGAFTTSASTSQETRATFKSCSFVRNRAPKDLGGAFRLGRNAYIELCLSTFSGNRGEGGVISNGYADADGENNGIGTFPLVPTIPFVSTDDETVVQLFKASCT